MKRMGLLSILFLLMVFSCTESQKDEKRDSKEKVITKNFSSFIENGWNQKNVDSLRLVSVVNFVRHLNGIQVATNLNEMEANMNIFFTGFPDLKVTIDSSVIKNDHLYARWTFEGTNTGTFGETPATGKRVVVSGYSELSFDAKGRITNEDVYYNELALLQQLGYTLNLPIVE